MQDGVLRADDIYIYIFWCTSSISMALVSNRSFFLLFRLSPKLLQYTCTCFTGSVCFSAVSVRRSSWLKNLACKFDNQKPKPPKEKTPPTPLPKYHDSHLRNTILERNTHKSEATAPTEQGAIRRTYVSQDPARLGSGGDYWWKAPKTIYEKHHMVKSEVSSRACIDDGVWRGGEGIWWWEKGWVRRGYTATRR